MHRRPIVVAAFFVLVATPALAVAQTSPCPVTWTRTLRVGSTGADVRALQRFLNASADTMIAAGGAGSSGSETSTFGGLTAAAVSKFQEKYATDVLAPVGLTAGTGIVGPATRTKLNALCAAPASLSATSPALSAPASSVGQDVLTIGDPGQPESSIAPAGSGVTFISFTLAAGSKDVTVNSITVQQVGMANDGAFASIALNDVNFLQIGNQFPLNSYHTVVFKTPFIVPASTSETFTIVGYMAADLSDFVGQVATLEIRDVSASSPVSGTLPLRGSPQTLNNSLVIGGATAVLSPLDPGSATTHYIGEKAVRFSAIRMTANSQEDVTLSYMIWDQTGTAGPDDITNVQTVVGTSSYPAQVQPDGRTYITLFDPAVVIPKGQSADVSVQGDIATTGAGRTAEFDLYDNTDDEGTGGATYGFGVGVVPSGNTATAGTHSAFITSDGTSDGTTGTPFFAGSVVSISPGTFMSVGR